MSRSIPNHQILDEQLTVLRSVSWSAYNELAAGTDRAGRLLTFDRGVLEIMSPSRAHELYKTMLGRMVEMVCLHHEIDLASAASTTFKRDDLQCGFEADESYYISHEAQVRNKTAIDLSIDPPPDLVIEVKQSRPAIDKLELLAAMGVPEVWRYKRSAPPAKLCSCAVL